MSDIAIKVENLGKSYLVGHNAAKAESYTALRDVIARNAKNLARKTRDMLQGRAIVHGDEVEEFWALKDINFEIKQGDRVGIIGRNGAGKSTLLKVLSRITEPTNGRVSINGRVASLLEVGTGFHPELTGRENIFLNGAILGMSRREIQRKFDEIIEFAEVERFLDTPVKRYSSGMYVRLAFAVAAHLEPEILIVDEVLAVGDVEFQKKCIGKMEEVSSDGRTILFVSHIISAINSLTQKCIYLKNGAINSFGETPVVVGDYLLTKDASKGQYTKEKNIYPYISSVEVITKHKNNVHESGDELLVVIKIKYDNPIPKSCFSFQIVNEYGVSVGHFRQYDGDSKIGYSAGEFEIYFTIPSCRLNVGRYTLTCFLSDPPGGKQYECLQDVCEFTVEVLSKTTLFGWRPEACTHLEEFYCKSKLISN
jgi:lipopolysaccharide transport system ATP-binding protein